MSLLRQPGAGALDTVWAEDGAVFLDEAVRHGPLEAIGRSYAGYFHLIPRLLAGLAALAPPSTAAMVLAVEAALVTALAALLVYVAAGAHLTSPLSRFAVAGIVVVAPLAQDDALNSIANLHWCGLYVLFWMLIWTPRSRAGRVVAAAAVALVAGSDILVLAFVPLALLRAANRGDRGGRRDRHGILLAALLIAGLALQMAGLVFGASSRPLSPNPVRAAVGYVLRAVPAPLVGQRWLGAETVTTRWLALAALAWLVLAVVALVAWRGGTWGLAVRPAWALAVAALLHSAALYMLPVVLTGVATPRYALAPAMLIVTGLVALLQPADADSGRMRSTAPLYALLGLLAVVCAVNLRVDNARADGPRWGTELDRARQACSSPNGAAVDGPLQVPIAPADDNHWRAELPCRYIGR